MIHESYYCTQFFSEIGNQAKHLSKKNSIKKSDHYLKEGELNYYYYDYYCTLFSYLLYLKIDKKRTKEIAQSD